MTEVLIADDSPVLREGLAAVLRAEGMTVVATVASVDALHLRLEIDQPDVALVGIPIPPAGRDHGLCAIEQMRMNHPGVGVLAVSSYFDPGVAVRLVNRRPASTDICSRSPPPTSQRSFVRSAWWRAAGRSSAGR